MEFERLSGKSTLVGSKRCILFLARFGGCFPSQNTLPYLLASGSMLEMYCIGSLNCSAVGKNIGAFGICEAQECSTPVRFCLFGTLQKIPEVRIKGATTWDCFVALRVGG